MVPIPSLLVKDEKVQGINAYVPSSNLIVMTDLRSSKRISFVHLANERVLSSGICNSLSFLSFVSYEGLKSLALFFWAWPLEEPSTQPLWSFIKSRTWVGLGLYLPCREPVHNCTTSPELNRLHPLGNSKKLGRLGCVHGIMSTVDERTVHDSSSCHNRSQAFTSIKNILTIWFLNGLIIQPSNNKMGYIISIKKSCTIPATYTV